MHLPSISSGGFPVNRAPTRSVTLLIGLDRAKSTTRATYWRMPLRTVGRPSSHSSMLEHMLAYASLASPASRR
ncbi:MAG: hypothetical protein OXD41_06230 [Thaumarchaeota archaeon]|nr:hypothetical protein [Nitrososphaerota archaeon]